MHLRITAAVTFFSLIILASCSGPSVTPGDGLLAPSVRSQSAYGRTIRSVIGPKAVTLTVLHSFASEGDGAYPAVNLTNVSGTLYGTTGGGGMHNAGTVFSVTTSGTYAQLFNFHRGIDGAYPHSSLTNENSTLFGTTFQGGANKYGTVFRITPLGVEKVLYSFAGGSDGSFPLYAGLTNVAGTLYGTTVYGGAGNCSGIKKENRCGTVFQITKKGAETILYRFAGGSNGANPVGGLTNVNGTLYGTTETGGAYNLGTVFSITTAGIYKQLYSFGSHPGDGDQPSSALTELGGKFYGTTYGGGANNWGTVYTITPSGAESVLYSFCQFAPCDDGADPAAGLTKIGRTLYGTTSGGGANGDGTVFSITTKGLETVLYSFCPMPPCSDGSRPMAGLTNVNGVLYGTTLVGGSGLGNGTVFSLSGI